MYSVTVTSVAVMSSTNVKEIKRVAHLLLPLLCFSNEIRGMIPQELLHANDMLNSVDGYSQPTPQLQGVSEDWLAFPKIVSKATPQK